MVGISLLTLVPGQLGGSETYVRELLRSLGRVGELSYRVLLPPVAPDAAEGLPAETATDYRSAWTVPQRVVAMTRSRCAARAAAPRPARRGRRPLSADPANSGARAEHRDPSRRAAPRPAGHVPALRAPLPQARVASLGSLGRAGDRAERIRTGSRGCAPSARSGADPSHPARARSCVAGTGPRETRAVPALPRASVAAQESPAALRGICARAPRMPGTAARPHRRRRVRRRSPTASRRAATFHGPMSST